MKFLQLLIIINAIGVCTNGYTQETTDPKEVKVITIKHEGLKEIIKEIYTGTGQFLWEKHILFILPGFDADTDKFGIGLTEKSFIGREAAKENILPVGYLKYENIETLIFGTNIARYFSDTGQVKKIDWFEYEPIPQGDGSIDILMPYYDFPSREYTVGKDNELTFIENNWFFEIR